MEPPYVDAAATPEMPFRDGFTRSNGVPVMPIVIGVVGHRRVRPGDRETLKQKLKAVFIQFKEAYPNTPLVVLSALAEGADQVAARAALDREVGAFVRAPLPFVPEIYRQSTSFDSHEGREELRSVLANRKVEWFVVPFPNGTAGPRTDWLRVATDRTDESCKELRYRCFANAGGYITRRCHILIALLDERDQGRTRGPSGTAEYVDFKLNGRAPALYPWTFAEPLGYRNERRLVMVIDTPRADPAPIAEDGANDLSPDRPVGEPQVLVPNNIDARWTVPQEWLPLARRISSSLRFWSRVKASLGFLSHVTAPDPSEQRQRRIKAELRQFRETSTNVDDFNRDLARPKVAQDIQQRLRSEDKLQAPHFDEQHNRWLLRLSGMREAAAALSGHLQPQLDHALFFVLALLGASIVAFHLYAHWFEYDRVVGHTEHYSVFLIVFLILLAAAAAVVAVAWWSRLDERRLDGRTLAEALRVRRAWALAGHGGSVADSYSGQIRSEVSWIRQSLLHVCPPPQVWPDQYRMLSDDQKLELLGQVREDWVKGQMKQHQNGYKKQHRAATNLRRWGFGLAVGGWLILVALLTSHWWAPVLKWCLATVGVESTAALVTGGNSEQANPEAEYAPPSHPPLSSQYPRHWILILASSLVIAGGLSIAYCERRSYEELSKQYERMAILFANGDRELADRLAQRDVSGAQSVIAALGNEAIIEHAQWLILRRARQLELHIGG
jgi:hypothetical protein